MKLLWFSTNWKQVTNNDICLFPVNADFFLLIVFPADIFSLTNVHQTPHNNRKWIIQTSFMQLTEAKELMRLLWINNNFTHSCFIISAFIPPPLSSSLSLSLSLSRSYISYESLWDIIFVCLQFLFKKFSSLFFNSTHPRKKQWRKKTFKNVRLCVVRWGKEKMKNQRSRYIYPPRSFLCCFITIFTLSSRNIYGEILISPFYVKNVWKNQEKAEKGFFHPINLYHGYV